jgi:hypothetical protein
VEEADPALAGFNMPEALAEYKVVWAKEAAEQQAILESIQSKAEVEANHRFLWQVAAEVDEIFADTDSDEELEVHPVGNDHESGDSDTNFINISNDEDVQCTW